jgi:hypothetical protein
MTSGVISSMNAFGFIIKEFLVSGRLLKIEKTDYFI